MDKLISLVVPCYNEEETISLFYKETTKILNENNIKYELIFINDGSSDYTAQEIEKLIKIDKNIIFIDFSRNFGKEAAMYAGLEHSTGNAVIVMDADLQHHPKYIPTMIEKWDNPSTDIQVVCARRIDRKGENKIISFFSNMFYKIINKISDVEFLAGVMDYRLLDRTVVDSILRLNEKNRFSKGIFRWVGFETEYIEFENEERIAGVTSWNFWKLCAYAIDGIISFSNTPLYISIVIGILTSISSFIFFVHLVIKTLLFGIDLPGYASTVSLILFMGGMQLLFIGILGLYIVRIFIEIKDRPIYIVKRIIRDGN